ncbi:hypothetical protein [Shinella zoogloeoides]|uniref:hypothetical protein n=1 Tax=Shinella zoogloeoides TaxID=352475 RepID=UPI00299EFAC8|nr:hypothetical protein [Shinella zoogloeoides]WPE19885.1 hypothetical protein ShzoTeo12_10610 [Shinella zoogloeoides]
MAKLTDFPPSEVAMSIQSIVDRSKLKFGGHAGFLFMELTLDHARMFWAASKHLEFLSDWGVGIETTRYSLEECRVFIDELIKTVRSSLRVRLDFEELMLLRDAATHIDRLSIMQTTKPPSKRRNGGKKT